MPTHTFDELSRIEQETGLTFSGWLDYEGSLMPVFLRPGRTVEERRAKILRLNGRDNDNACHALPASKFARNSVYVKSIDV